MNLSKVALASAAALAGSTMLAGAPAFAQGNQQQQGQAAPGEQRQLQLSGEERAALAPLSQALTARNWAAAQAALPAAQAAAQGQDARYFVASAALQIAVGTQNTQGQMDAIDAVIASGGAPQADQIRLLRAQTGLTMEAQQFDRAHAATTRLIQLQPNDADLYALLADVERRRNNNAAALTALLRSIEISEAAGQTVSEARYRVAMALAYEARSPQAVDFARRLAQAYPTERNWTDALTVLGQAGNFDTQASLDLLRLMRASGSLSGQAVYLRFAQALDQAGLPGETKAVLEEGIARGAFTAADPSVAPLLATANRRVTEDRSELDGQITAARSAANGRSARIAADALAGYGRHADAIELYRLALSKGGEDANLINTRLGATLLAAGQRAEAEAAFRAVTGDRAPLAQFWLAWLARSQG
jgi:hypothetical protein